MNVAAMGRFKNTMKLPRDMISERRIAVSNSGPITKPSTMGAGS
jgi:hypothetical protein